MEPLPAENMDLTSDRSPQSGMQEPNESSPFAGFDFTTEVLPPTHGLELPPALPEPVPEEAEPAAKEARGKEKIPPAKYIIPDPNVYTYRIRRVDELKLVVRRVPREAAGAAEALLQMREARPGRG